MFSTFFTFIDRWEKEDIICFCRGKSRGRGIAIHAKRSWKLFKKKIRMKIYFFLFILCFWLSTSFYLLSLPIENFNPKLSPLISRIEWVVRESLKCGGERCWIERIKKMNKWNDKLKLFDKCTILADSLFELNNKKNDKSFLHSCWYKNYWQILILF